LLDKNAPFHRAIERLGAITSQNRSGSFADYLLASAVEIPPIELIGLDTPNRKTPTGSKGMAEGGVMGSIGVLMSAVNDALQPFGVVADRQPLTATVYPRTAAQQNLTLGTRQPLANRMTRARIGRGPIASAASCSTFTMNPFTRDSRLAVPRRSWL
jgi:hypothetical protein